MTADDVRRSATAGPVQARARLDELEARLPCPLSGVAAPSRLHDALSDVLAGDAGVPVEPPD
ncbi:hypothetical protein [Nocardioides xinjiangensis]|uniref:hypothetical protein n=1 Tax=Nocardioides xinjiangensis TaxID=2817376 RepID=UPI001B31674F|nr:hypothetical protein [Nocardioides sp. SYSU D00778]